MSTRLFLRQFQLHPLKQLLTSEQTKTQKATYIQVRLDKQEWQGIAKEWQTLS